MNTGEFSVSFTFSICFKQKRKLTSDTVFFFPMDTGPDDSCDSRIIHVDIPSQLKLGWI